MLWLFFALGFYIGGTIAIMGLMFGALRAGLVPMPDELPVEALLKVIFLWPYTIPKGIMRGF